MADMISEKEFERAAREFLEANAEPRVDAEQAWGEGSDQVSLLPERSLEEELAELEASRGWAQKRFDAGFGWKPDVVGHVVSRADTSSPQGRASPAPPPSGTA